MRAGWTRLKLGIGKRAYLQSALVLRPPGGTPARLQGEVSCGSFGMLETKDSLVIAIAGLAYGPGAMDDNVD